jgi:hypothetical protein
LTISRLVAHTAPSTGSKDNKVEESSTADMVPNKKPYSLDVEMLKQTFDDLLGEDLFWFGVNHM